MSRRLQLGAILAVILVAATGCVRPGVDRGPLTGQTVEVAAIWTGAEQASFRVVLDAFEQRTGATVRYVAGGDDLPTLLNSRLSGGAPPDVALLGQPGVVEQLARRGALVELPAEIAGSVDVNFSPFWRSLGMVDDRRYGVPYKAAHKSVIWYRPAAFAEAGVGPPQTWDELLAASRTLADAGVGTMAVPGADGWVLTDWFENIYLRIAGPQRYDELARREIPWDHPSVVQALARVHEFWTLDRAIQDDAPQLKYVQAVADVFGTRPKSSMLFQGDFVVAEINRLGTAEVGEDAQFFSWPAVDDSPPAIITAGDQAVAFTAQEVVWELMAFLASPQAAAIAVAQGGFLSPNRSLDLSAYPDPVTRRLAESLREAELLRFDLSDLTPQAFGGGTNASMWRLLQDYLARPDDPQQLAYRLEAAARRDIGQLCPAGSHDCGGAA